jgi:CRP-like cAMP-binding protein
MKGASLDSLASKATLSELTANRVLFRAGDTDRRTLWLISGRLELREGDRTITVLSGGTPEARNPLSPTLPRQLTARAMDTIRYLAIDSARLDTLITWDQTGVYHVGELKAHLQSAEAAAHDWMTTLLQAPAFHRIPPANIQALFQRLQRTPCRAGEVVIKQGDEGDYFYIILGGKCVVTRETPLSREGLRLAELSVGDSFGEDALIAEAKRSATVRMLTDGELIRLKKADLLELMKEPLQQWVDYAEARKIIERGGSWLDVRLPSEYQNRAIDRAINIPLCFMRVKLTTLPRDVPYVVYCDTGRRSSAAAFVLLQQGFDAYVLRDGLASAAGPA